jgi:hypothetical protein
MNIDIKTILIVGLIIYLINLFNNKSQKKNNEDFNEHCNFEEFSDNVIDVISDSLKSDTTESAPESTNSESTEKDKLKTIDQINFESNYDIIDDSDNTGSTD